MTDFKGFVLEKFIFIMDLDCQTMHYKRESCIAVSRKHYTINLSLKKQTCLAKKKKIQPAKTVWSASI